MLVAVVALALLVTLVAVLANRKEGSPPASNQASSSTTAASNAPGTTAAGRSGGGGSQGQADVPAGWTSYRDPQTGFTIAYPSNWSVRTSGTLTDIRDPDTRAYLRVDHQQPPNPSPAGAWTTLEAQFAPANTNYKRIRIEPTTFKGYDAAVWEFTYSESGADLHALDLGFIAGDYGFALNFQTHAEDWDRLQPVFDKFKASFKAP